MADDRAYRVLVSYDNESSVYRARVPELELDVEADTRAEALQKAEAAIEAKVDEVAQSGDDLPRPADGVEVKGGPITITLAPMVMKDLTYFATRNQMTVEEMAAQMLARGVSQMLSPRPEQRIRPPRNEDDQPTEDRQEGPPREDRGGRGRGRRDKREGYRPDLDDKSNWLAYLREQEKGGGGRGRR
jgi:predicted RNase H-like HicB family nuclease